MYTQMGREMLEGLHVLPKPAAPIIQENQQTDHCPSRYVYSSGTGPFHDPVAQNGQNGSANKLRGAPLS